VAFQGKGNLLVNRARCEESKYEVVIFVFGGIGLALITTALALVVAAVTTAWWLELAAAPL
jgi:hypothetical protein